MNTIKYTVKNDIIFSYLFSHKKYLKNFLESLLDVPIQDLEVTSQFSLKRVKINNKMGVLDIMAKINNGSLVDIEMQRKKQSFYTKRVLLYASSLTKGQISAGENYKNINDVIMINILDFVRDKSISDVHTIWNFREKNNLWHDPLPGLEIHFIELPKFRKSVPDFNNKLNQWLALIDTKNKEWMEEAMSKNQMVKEAKKKVDEFTSNERKMHLIAMREKWMLDYNTAIDEATENGIVKGRKEGRNEGRKEGLDEAKIVIAKKMLSMNMNIKQIATITNLTESEVLKLK